MRPVPFLRFRLFRAGFAWEENGVRSTMLWARLLRLVKAVVEDVCFDEAEECIVVSVRPRKATKRLACGSDSRCGTSR